MVEQPKTTQTTAKMTASLSAFVPPGLLAELDKRAIDRFTSRSALVREAIDRFLKQ